MSSQNIKSCYVCSSSEDDFINYGELLPKTRTDSFVVHYFCVLLSSDIPQNGSDNEDVYGMLVEDIKGSMRKYARTKCRYCSKGRAASKCAITSCRVRFHASCAIKQNCLAQFIEPDNFNIYCLTHSPQVLTKIRQNYQYKVKADIKKRINRKPLSILEKNEKIEQLLSRISDRHFEEGNTCKICGESFTANNLNNVITPPCCWPHNGLKPNYREYGLHRNCVKFQAFYAGYKFKCPFCGDSGYFLTWVNKIGIFVPKRHALWEDSQFENRSLFGITATCNAESCQCQDGREYYVEEADDDFHQLICYTCGSQAVHRKCLNMPTIDLDYQYICDMCHISVAEESSGHQEAEISVEQDDFMDIEKDDLVTIELHDTDSEPEWTAEQLFEEMDEVKPIIKIPRPIPLVSRAYVQQQRNHFKFQIEKWVREQKENGNWNC